MILINKIVELNAEEKVLLPTISNQAKAKNKNVKIKNIQDIE